MLVRDRHVPQFVDHNHCIPIRLIAFAYGDDFIIIVGTSIACIFENHYGIDHGSQRHDVIVSQIGLGVRNLQEAEQKLEIGVIFHDPFHA